MLIFLLLTLQVAFKIQSQQTHDVVSTSIRRRRVPTGMTVTTGLSDRRKMVVTVLKESFQKVKLGEVIIKSI